MVLVRDGQFLAAMSTTGSQHATAILCGHSLAEAVLVDATAVVRLKCSFHLSLLLIYYLFLLFLSLCPSYGLQNLFLSKIIVTLHLQKHDNILIIYTQ